MNYKITIFVDTQAYNLTGRMQNDVFVLARYRVWCVLA